MSGALKSQPAPLDKGNQPERQDLHPAEIVAKLHMAGLSIRSLSIANGLHPNTLADTIRRRYPRGERIIARALQMKPEDIWPSRYPKRPRKRKA